MSNSPATNLEVTLDSSKGICVLNLIHKVAEKWALFLSLHKICCVFFLLISWSFSRSSGEESKAKAGILKSVTENKNPSIVYIKPAPSPLSSIHFFFFCRHRIKMGDWEAAWMATRFIPVLNATHLVETPQSPWRRRNMLCVLCFSFVWDGAMKGI